MAKVTGEELPAKPDRPRRNWLPLGVSAGVVVLLAVGWPLLSSFVSATEPVRPGEPVWVGGNGEYEASLTFERGGWAMDSALSRADQKYHFTRGPVELTLNSVLPMESPPPGEEELWNGMEKLARVNEASARLSDPAAITTDDGDPGLTGTLRSDSQQGVAVVYPSPDGRFAVELTLAGANATQADLAAVEDVTRSVSFSKGGTS